MNWICLYEKELKIITMIQFDISLKILSQNRSIYLMFFLISVAPATEITKMLFLDTILSSIDSLCRLYVSERTLLPIKDFKISRKCYKYGYSSNIFRFSKWIKTTILARMIYFYATLFFSSLQTMSFERPIIFFIFRLISNFRMGRLGRLRLGFPP